MRPLPIPPESLLADLIRDARKVGVKADAAELAIWRRAIHHPNCRGNAGVLARWMGVEAIWLRRHLRRLGLQDELDAARGRNGEPED